ncbi:hypothetical protein RJ640_028620 [Escallonia rubra]|uniref:Uncharacterized protein n=1 Tax=Escallonia rubra TaxID=112253 RepID=A0AA88UE82_9ASTE|nr:hypothetical protein RJ640_028620 [Escallonia rubra]
MKQIEVEPEGGSAKLEAAISPPPPPPPPPMPRLWVATKPSFKRAIAVSVTNEEIAKFWRQKRMVEEDHLLAAIKAAARIRARNLKDDDYKCFEESLNEDEERKENDELTKESTKEDASKKEVRVGIKDWWTKSKYAYLNQPAIESDKPSAKRRTSTYTPHFFCYKPTPPPASAFGIF